MKILHPLSLPPPTSSTVLSTAGTQNQSTKPDLPDPSREISVTDNKSPLENGPNVRKEEVSAEVPKFGVSGESQRASNIEIPTFKKDKA